MNAYRQSLCIALTRVGANAAMIGAVFLGMYQASRWPAWPSEAVFCLFFFGITIPAWIIAWRLGKWARKRWPGPARTVVALPRLGEQLVAWSVAPESARPAVSIRSAAPQPQSSSPTK